VGLCGVWKRGIKGGVGGISITFETWVERGEWRKMYVLSV